MSKKKYIYLLDADGPWRVSVGAFSSKEEANKAWRRWKYAYRATEWQHATKILVAHTIDTMFDEV